LVYAVMGEADPERLKAKLVCGASWLTFVTCDFSERRGLIDRMPYWREDALLNAYWNKCKKFVSLSSWWAWYLQW
jgi:hypothetical protein